MPLPYSQNKSHIISWRTTCRDKYLDSRRQTYKRSYVPILMYKWETESKRLRDIRI